MAQIDAHSVPGTKLRMGPSFCSPPFVAPHIHTEAGPVSPSPQTETCTHKVRVTGSLQQGSAHQRTKGRLAKQRERQALWDTGQRGGGDAERKQSLTGSEQSRPRASPGTTRKSSPEPPQLRCRTGLEIGTQSL